MTAHSVKKRVDSSVPRPIIGPKPTATSHPFAEVDMGAKIESHNGKLDTYYGSNTGTCKNLFCRIYDDSKKLGFDTTVHPLNVAAFKGFEKD